MNATTTSPAYPVPSRLNAAVVVLQAAAVAACFAAIRDISGGWPLAAAAVAFAVVMNSVYASIHEAEHGILFAHPRLNDAAGAALALLFPAPFHLIRQGHLGHHLRNRTDDEAFDLWFPGESRVWRWLQFYGILTGFYWMTVVLSIPAALVAPSVFRPRPYRFDRASTAFFASLDPRFLSWIRIEAALAAALHAGIVLGAGIPPLRYALLYAAFGFSWSAMQYVHHYGTERDVVRGARNLWILPGLDRAWLNHNWHLTHHKNPSVSWRYLPALGRREDPDRGFLPWAYLRMWRGPRRASERVENVHAGRHLP